MLYRHIVLAAVALLLCACAHPTPAESDIALGPDYASEMPPAKSGQITKFADRNRDGKVTRQEAQADPVLAKNFDRYDLDHNHVLDRGEFARLENAGHPGTGSGVETGFTLEAPTAMPYDEAAQEAPASNPSLNRTGTDQIHPQ